MLTEVGCIGLKGADVVFTVKMAPCLQHHYACVDWENRLALVAVVSMAKWQLMSDMWCWPYIFIDKMVVKKRYVVLASYFYRQCCSQ